MAFRNAAPAPPVRRVVIGPFRTWRGRIAFGVLLAVVVGGLALIGGHGTSLLCTGGRCLVTHGFPLGQVRALPRAAIAAVDVRRATGRRGPSDRWDVVLLDERGAELLVAARDSVEEARRVKDELRAFVDGSVPSVRIETPRRLGARIAALLALAIGLTLVAYGLRGAGRIVVTLDPSRDALTFARRAFGLPLGRPTVLPLGDVTDVRLEHGPVPDALRVASHPPETGARLVLVLADGRSVPLTRDLLRGERACARGFGALRAALALARIEPPAAPVSPSPVAPRPTRRSIALVAAVVVVGVGAALAVSLWGDPGPGAWLDLRADHRCRFQGAELLPGGEMRMRLAPGDYPYEVWTRDGWQKRTIHLRRDEDQVVVCR